MRCVLLACILACLSASAQPERRWDDTRNAARRAYKERDAGGFEHALRQLAADNSARAVDEIIACLELAEQLDAYPLAVRLLARMTSPAARARLTQLAGADSPSWEARVTALEARSFHDDGLAPLLAALDAEHALLQRHAIRIGAALGTPEVIDKLIELLAAHERKGGRFSQRGRELRRGLVMATGKRLRLAKSYRAWWSALTFVEKEALLAPRRRAPLVVKREPIADQEPAKRPQGSVSPLMDGWRRKKPQAWRYLRALDRKDVIVVSGYYDRVQSVLKHLGIKHTLVSRKAFADVRLGPHQVLIFNCTHTAPAAQHALRLMGKGHVPLELIGPPRGAKAHERLLMMHALSKADIQRVAAFVRAGGYLFTSDWELYNVLARAFPSYIGISGYVDQDKVVIQPAAEGVNHPLLEGVFSGNPHSEREYRWQIDNRSFTPQLKHPEVVPLITSPDLAKVSSSDHVAITFQPAANGTGGGPQAGRVLHVLGHFSKQRDGASDDYALQKLLLNFLDLKRKQRGR